MSRNLSTTAHQDVGDPARPALATAAVPLYTELQHVPLSTDLAGALRVSVTGGAAGGTSAVDESAFTEASSTFTPSGGVYDDTLVASVAGQQQEVRLSKYRAFHVDLRRNTDGLEIGTLAVPLRNQQVGTADANMLSLGGTALSGADVVDVANTALRVNVVAGSSGSSAVGATGAAVPASADYEGVNVAGTLRGRTAVNPSGAIYAAATDLSSIAGTTAAVNTGVVGAGTLRVVIATDQVQLTNKLLVTPDLPSGASTAAKQPALGTAGTASADVITVQGIASMTPLLVNVSQINGVTPLMGNGVTGTGSHRVTVASDNTPFPIKIDQTTPGTTNLVTVSGSGAAAAAVAGNPVRLGALGRSTLPTIVASAQLVDVLADRYGRLFEVAPICVTKGSNTTPITLAAPTTTELVAAPSAGSHLRIYRLWAQNLGAAASALTAYWSEGTTKKIPFQVLGGQPFSMAEDGRWELPTATALNIISTVATNSPSVEWYVEYETLVD